MVWRCASAYYRLFLHYGEIRPREWPSSSVARTIIPRDHSRATKTHITHKKGTLCSCLPEVQYGESRKRRCNIILVPLVLPCGHSIAGFGIIHSGK